MLTQARLHQVLDYNPTTGVFTWKVSCRGTLKGERAGTLQPNGYRRICVDYERYYEQRLAWFYMYGVWPKNIDHRNRATATNTSAELREATQSQNLINAKLRSDNTSGHKGVSLHKSSGLWRARLYVNKKEMLLGYFDDPQTAHAAYMAAAKQHYGQFVRAR